MRSVGNNVIFRPVRKGAGECVSVARQHAGATELGSPKLNWRLHVLQALRGWECIEWVRQHKGFDPRVMSQVIGGYLSTSDLFANRRSRVRARNIGVREIRVTAGQHQARVAAARKAKKAYPLRVEAVWKRAAQNLTCNESASASIELRSALAINRSTREGRGERCLGVSRFSPYVENLGASRADQPHCSHGSREPQYRHHALEVVRQHMQAHLGAHVR
jgi:hypothetical protein